MALGKRLKELLKDRGITILEFATITGISKNTLYGITKRDSDNITFENLQKIADALDMTVDEFIGYDTSKNMEENMKDGFYYVDTGGKVVHIPPERTRRNQSVFASKQEKRLNSYRKILNEKGMSKALEQMEILTQIPEYRKDTADHLQVNAAHARTDVDIPEGADTSDDDIMNDDNF